MSRSFNRTRTGHYMCAHNLYKWWRWPNLSCDYDTPNQTLRFEGIRRRSHELFIPHLQALIGSWTRFKNILLALFFQYVSEWLSNMSSCIALRVFTCFTSIPYVFKPCISAILYSKVSESLCLPVYNPVLDVPFLWFGPLLY